MKRLFKDLLFTFIFVCLVIGPLPTQISSASTRSTSTESMKKVGVDKFALRFIELSFDPTGEVLNPRLGSSQTRTPNAYKDVGQDPQKNPQTDNADQILSRLGLTRDDPYLMEKIFLLELQRAQALKEKSRQFVNTTERALILDPEKAQIDWSKVDLVFVKKVLELVGKDYPKYLKKIEGKDRVQSTIVYDDMSSAEIQALKSEIQRARAAELTQSPQASPSKDDPRSLIEVISDSHKDYYANGKKEKFLIDQEDDRVKESLKLAKAYQKVSSEYLQSATQKLGDAKLAEAFRQALVDQYILYVLIPTKKILTLLNLFSENVLDQYPIASFYLVWPESIQGPYRLGSADVPEEMKRFQRQAGPGFESTSEMQMELFKNSGSIGAYVAALKIMTARTLINQVYYHQNVILNRDQDVLIPKGCQSPALSSRDGLYKSEKISNEQRNLVLNSLVDGMGVAMRLDEIETPQGVNQVGQSSSELKRVYDLNLSLGGAGVGSKNPYSVTPFESYRAAQFGVLKDKRDQRVEPGFDDLNDFSTVYEYLLAPKVATQSAQSSKQSGRAYPAGFPVEKYKSLSGIMKKVFQLKADQFYCEKGPCQEGDAPYLILKNWPAYLVELVGDDPRPYMSQGVLDPEKFMCSGAKDLLRTFTVRMPAPRMYGSNGYRDWALSVLSKSLFDYLSSKNPEQEYAGFDRLIAEQSEFCAEWKKLNPKSSCGNTRSELRGIKEPLLEILGLLNKGAADYLSDASFRIFQDDYQIDELKKYDLVLRNLWHVFAQYVGKRKEMGLWKNSDGTNKIDYFTQTEWNYIKESVESGANPWVNFRLAFVRAYVCDPDLRKERSKAGLTVHPLRSMGDVLNFTSSKASCTDQQVEWLSNTSFFSNLKTKRDFREYCELNVPISPYYGNRVLSDAEKMKVWEQRLESDLEVSRELTQIDNQKVSESLGSLSRTYYGLNPATSKNSKFSESGLDRIERIFREPLVLDESDYNKLRKKYFSGEASIAADAERYLQDLFLREPFKTAKVTSQYYKEVYQSKMNSGSKVEKFLKLRNQAIEQDLEDFDIDQRDLRNDVVRVDQVYRRALYVEAIQYQSIKNLKTAQESLENLCALSPMKNPEDFRRVVLATLRTQNALNQSWGLDAAPSEIMSEVMNYEYPWALQGYFMAGFLAMSLLSAGCTVMSFGLCLVPIAAVAAGVTAWAQTEMIVYIWDQMKDTEEREKFLDTYIKIGTSDKSAYDYTGNEGWGTLSLELVMGVPIVGSSAKFAGQGVRSLDQFRQAFRVARAHGKGIVRSSMSSIGTGSRALFSPRVGRLSEAGAGLYYLGIIKRTDSFDAKVVAKVLSELADKGDEVVFKGFAQEVGTRFGGSPNRFRKFLETYTDFKFLQTAEKDLESLSVGSDRMGFTNRILTLGGIKGLKSFIQNRAAKKLISAQKITRLNQKLKALESSGGDLEKFVYENADEIYQILNSMAYRGRDIFYEALFQGPVTSAIIENGTRVATAGLGSMHRLSPMQGMIDFSQLRRLSHSVSHVLLEARRMRAQKILGFSEEIITNPKTFDLVGKLALSVDSVIAKGASGGISQRELDELRVVFARFKDTSADKIINFWSKFVENPKAMGPSAFWDKIRGSGMYQGSRIEILDEIFKHPDAREQVKQLLFEPGVSRVGRLVPDEQEELARLLWNSTPQKVLFEETKDLGISAEVVLKNTLSYSSFDEFEYYKSAFDVLRMKARLEGQKF